MADTAAPSRQPVAFELEFINARSAYRLALVEQLRKDTPEARARVQKAKERLDLVLDLHLESLAMGIHAG